MSVNMKSQSIITGYLFAIGATAIWSGNFIVARGLHDSIPPVSLAFFRWLVAGIALTPFAIKNLIEEWPIIKKHPVYFAITSFLGITTFNTLIYFAAQTTTAMNLSLIAITFPIFIILLSRILYKEVLTVKKAIGIILVLTGVLFLITKGNFSILLDISFNIGDVWMLIAAIVFSVYSLFLKNKPEQISIKSLQLSTFILGLIFLLPFFIWEQAATPATIFTATSVGAILYIGLFASLGAFFLWNNAIIILGPSKAGMVYYALPVFCGLLAHLFLDENVRLLHLYSMVLIFSGIVITNHEPKKSN
ncbi:MAG: DMT family transporter [Desulfobacula sp.]|nr:DMT family transporter [Desulfobacula sp.]